MRRVLKALLILVIGLPVLAAAGYWYLQQQISQAGISNLQLDLNRLTLSSASFHRVTFNLLQDGATQQVNLSNVKANWHWQSRFTPVLDELSIGPGLITLSASAAQTEPDKAAAITLPDQWQLPTWLPKQLSIDNLTVILPCPVGQCATRLTGYFKVFEHTEPSHNGDSEPVLSWQTQLQLSPQLQQADSANDTDADKSNSIMLDASYQLSPEPMLTVTVQQDKQLGLSLKQQIDRQSQLATTELALALSPPSAANQLLLQQWGLVIPDGWVSQFQQPVQLYSKLNWQLPEDGDLRSLLTSHQLAGLLVARAPDPFLLPDIGLVQGELNVDFSIKDQLVERWQLTGNATVTEMPLSKVVNHYGIDVSALELTLNSVTSEPLNINALPLQLSISSNGADRLNFNSELSIDLSSKPKINVKKAGFAATIATLTSPDNEASQQLSLTKLKLKSSASGYWQPDNWQLQLTDTNISSAAVTSNMVQTAAVIISAANSKLAGGSDGLSQLSSTLNVKATNLTQPLLVTQSWQWQGSISGKPADMLITGQLSNDGGLSLTHNIAYLAATGVPATGMPATGVPANSSLAIKWQLPDTFLLAGNPLAATLQDWPALLSVNKGRLMASGEIELSGDAIKSTSTIQLGDVAGIYDRTLFSGLTANITMQLADNQLQLQTTDLILSRLNHGFELGPARLNASATMPVAAPGQSKLDIRQADIQVMQGVISANNQQLDFSQSKNQLLLQLQQIDLAKLLQQHPTGDLKGNGKLSGTVPLTISNSGVTVTNGSLAAEAPGGSLQYRSASTSAMAKTNNNMKLVVDALDNFHYSVLSSNVSYDTSGKLLLALNLQGRNPELQQGRPINLNINLEEDLPALITSLQLTNKLNEVITKRVQQYLKQQQAAAAAKGDKP